MNRILITLLLLLAAIPALRADDKVAADLDRLIRSRHVIEGSEEADADGATEITRRRTLEHPGSGMQSVFRGKYHKVTEEGDTVLVLVFNDITVYPELRFKNKKQQQFYWRTVRDVKKTLPMAKLISETLLETYEYIETFPTQAERERYLKEMEGAIFRQYKPVLRKFTKSQARMLVKLIQRETNQSGYDILRHLLARLRPPVRSEPQRPVQPRHQRQRRHHRARLCRRGARPALILHPLIIRFIRIYKIYKNL